MALATTDSNASFDNTLKKLDLSAVLSAIILNDAAAMGLFGLGEPMLATDHRFNEDSLNAPTVTAAEALDDSETGFDVSDASKLRIGALLMDESAGKSEIVQVTAISSNTLTVVRGYGSTSAEEHADATTWAIVGMPVQEGDETITDISKARTQKTQYSQIFKREVKVSGTAEAEANNGLHPGIASELKHQVMRRADELKVEMNRAILNSVISASAGSDTVYRTMKGLREYLTAGGANVDTDAEALSEGVVNELVRECWDDGGNPKHVLGHAEQLTRFSSFNSAKLRVAPSDRVAGTFVNKFLSSLGIELELVMDRWFKTDEIAVVQKDLIYYAPLKGRTLTMEPLAKIGDAYRWMLIGEGGLIVRNAAEAHAYHTNLTV